jgi:hypothetical protein
MAVIEGTQALKTYSGEYDFAVDGGAISTITLRASQGSHGPIPNGAIIEGGFIEVDTLLTSGGAATVAVQVESAGDLQAAAAVSGAPWSSTGRKAVVPVFTAATFVKTTASRSPALVIAAATVTAGKFRVVLHYR